MTAVLARGVDNSYQALVQYPSDCVYLRGDAHDEDEPPSPISECSRADAIPMRSAERAASWTPDLWPSFSKLSLTKPAATRYRHTYTLETVRHPLTCARR